MVGWINGCHVTLRVWPLDPRGREKKPHLASRPTFHGRINYQRMPTPGLGEKKVADVSSTLVTQPIVSLPVPIVLGGLVSTTGT